MINTILIFCLGFILGFLVKAIHHRICNLRLMLMIDEIMGPCKGQKQKEVEVVV